jgi:hypothetical protein
MYKIVESPNHFIDSNNKKRKPIASMECEVEGLVHICEDDNCYIVFCKYSKEYEPATYLCAEVIEFLYSLPKLRIRHWFPLGMELIPEDD